MAHAHRGFRTTWLGVWGIRVIRIQSSGVPSPAYDSMQINMRMALQSPRSLGHTGSMFIPSPLPPPPPPPNKYGSE